MKKSDSKNYRESKNKQNLTQIGALFNVEDNTTIGFSLSDNRSNTETSSVHDINVSQRLQMIDLITKHDFKNNMFLAGNFGYGRITNKFKNQDLTKFNQNVMKVGFLGGINYDLYNLTITPHVGIQHYAVQGKNFDLEQAKIVNNRNNPTILTAGLNLKHNVLLAENVKLQPMVSVNYHSKSLGGEKYIEVNNHKFKYQFEDGLTTQVGFNVSSNSFDFSLTGGVEKSKGYRKNNSLNTSISYKF